MPSVNTGASSFGPYEIVASLGEGGGGHVFRAWDPRLRREVALKILHERSTTAPERLARLLAEARAASALNHPNILTVFDASVDGATPFIVSELIEGTTLREEIRRGPLPLRRLLDLAVQIADGLAAAHDAGIVHRDLKPENIMVTRSGRAKILDFGLVWSGGSTEGQAAARSVDDTVTELGLRAGTVPYMSPEQARGVPADFRADQFSFGLILYEMATGRALFRRATPAATLDAIVNEDVPAIVFPDPRTPVMLRWIIERCLAKAADDRYGVTGDLYRDLRTLRDRLNEAVVPVTADAPRARAWRRLQLAAAVLAGIAAGASIMGLFASWERAEVPELQFMPLATTTEYEGQPAWSPDGNTIAYVKEVNGLLQIHTRGLSASTAAAVTDRPFDCKSPFWSGDGKRIYYVSAAQGRDGIWSVGAAGGMPQLVVKDAIRGAISPDGTTIAFLRDESRGDIVPASGVFLAKPQGEGPWTPDAVEAAAVRYEPLGKLRFVEAALAFSPDGRTLAIAGVGEVSNLDPTARGWQFWVLPLDGGAPLRRFRSLPDVAPRESAFTWLPDNKHLVLGLLSLAPARSHLYLGDLDRDTASPVTRSADAEQYPSASPAGDRIVFVRGESDFDLTDISLSHKTVRPLLSTARNESDPSWARDGQRYAYVTDRRGQDEIWVRSRDGASDQPVITQELFGDDSTVMLAAPTFSPDGQRLAYVRTGFKPIWPLRIYTSLVAGGTPVPLLPVTHDAVQVAPSWSPDGQWIAYSEWKDRKWMLVKVRVGSSERVVLREDGVPNATPQWAPSDDWITWETPQGLQLVSADGEQQRSVFDRQLLVHTWSRDGREIIGIEETEDFRMSLIAITLANRTERVLADLGPAPPVNNQVKGLSMSGEGASVATSTVRMRGDLWIVSGVDWRGWIGRLWRGLSKPQ
ncbi:MAG TPA: protein kinase [Vicinamibacterales bacterium]|nr:protein kinase [Vicinamibacterales bacterium]